MCVLQALAKSVVKGKCFKKYKDAHAKTEIEAYVDSYKAEYAECKVNAKAEGNAGASGKGKAKTKVV
jgi:hypothetical protein